MENNQNISPQVSEIKETKKTKKRKRLLIISIVSLFLLLFVASVYYFLTNDNVEDIFKEEQSKGESYTGLDFSIWFHRNSWNNEVLYRFQNDYIEKINILMEGFETGGSVLSSDGEYTAFLYLNKDQDYDKDWRGGFGQNFRKGIAYIYNNNSQEIIILKENGNYTHRHLEWSPDDRYLSYLGIGGNSGIIDIKRGEEIKTLNSGILVTWIDNDTFSFIDDNKLYLYSISQEKETLVTDYVLQSYRTFEAQPIYQKPYWSPDGKFVVYSESDNGWEEDAVLFDIENQQKYYFGDVLTDVVKESLRKERLLWDRVGDVNTSFIGWDNNKFFYYSDGKFSWESIEHGDSKDPVLKSIKVINGEKIIEDWFSIDDRYNFFSKGESSILTQLNIHPFLYFNGIIYDIKSKEEICVLKSLNEDMWSYKVKAHGDYLFIYYGNKKNDGTKLINSESDITILEIHNVKTCEYLDSITIEDKINYITIVD